MTQTFSDVACTVCGCVCDDLSITVEDGRVVDTERACDLAKPWLLEQRAGTNAATVDGRPATRDVAYQRAVELLKAARSPLIYGLSRSTTNGQRAAVALADRIGATIDTTASTGHAPSIVALQQAGESTCTLGEVKQRADLVIYWGSDPDLTHPRHRERYAPPRPGRTTIVVDDEETDTARSADEFLSVSPGCHREAFATLRLLLQGIPPRRGANLGMVLDDLQRLIDRMKSCSFGIIFFGSGLTAGPMAHRTVEELLRLVTDLNAFTRFYARRMRRYGDVAGADSVLAWQTGYPFGVNLNRGYPHSNPGETTGPDLLARGDVDLCLFVGSSTAKDFPLAALDRLRRIPVIALDPPGEAPIVPAAVSFRTAVYGIHRPGTAYRMDEVPIPLRVLIPTELPGDDEILAELLRRLDSVTV